MGFAVPSFQPYRNRNIVATADDDHHTTVSEGVFRHEGIFNKYQLWNALNIHDRFIWMHGCNMQSCVEGVEGLLWTMMLDLIN